MLCGDDVVRLMREVFVIMFNVKTMLSGIFVSHHSMSVHNVKQVCFM